jgi:hypothetical protein
MRGEEAALRAWNGSHGTPIHEGCIAMRDNDGCSRVISAHGLLIILHVKFVLIFVT